MYLSNIVSNSLFTSSILISILLPGISCILSDTVKNHKHVTEAAIKEINGYNALKASINDLSASIENVTGFNDQIIMRSGTENNSLLKFSKPFSHPNWAAEFKINNMHLHDMQTAGVYLWYTKHELKMANDKSFKGANGTFTGIMAGIEFMKEKAQLVFSYNAGYDFSGATKYDGRLKYDTINLESLKNNKNNSFDLTIKVIHTKKNFIIELWKNISDNEHELISDTFRIDSHIIDISDKDPGYFGLTASYENCPKNIFVELKSFNILERDEADGYEPEDHHVELNNFSKSQSSAEIRHAVAELGFFMNYAHIALGSDKHNAITDITAELKDKYREIRGRIEKSLLLIQQSETSSLLIKNNEDKIKLLEKRLSDIQASINNYIILLKNKKTSTHFEGISNLIMAFAIIGILIVIVKQVTWKLMMRGREIKVE